MNGIVLVGGSRLLRGGLKRMLEEAGADIVGDHASPDEVKPREVGVTPVVYLLMQSPASRGIRQEIANLRRIDPESRIAVMRANLATKDLVEVFTAGGDGFVLEDINAEALNESLNLIALGEKVFPSQLATLLSGDQRRSETMLGRSPLTSREYEIVEHLALGKSNKEIANELNLALATVKVHVKSLLKKLGLSNRTQAAIWALDSGLIEPPSVAAKAEGDLQDTEPTETAGSAPGRNSLRDAEVAKLLMQSAIDRKSPAGVTPARFDARLEARATGLPPHLPATGAGREN